MSFPPPLPTTHIPLPLLPLFIKLKVNKILFAFHFHLLAFYYFILIISGGWEGSEGGEKGSRSIDMKSNEEIFMKPLKWGITARKDMKWGEKIKKDLFRNEKLNTSPSENSFKNN